MEIDKFPMIISNSIEALQIDYDSLRVANPLAFSIIIILYIWFLIAKPTKPSFVYR